MVPLGRDQPSPDRSRVSSSLAYELLRTVRITDCVRTGSIVPKGGNTVAFFDLSAEAVLSLGASRWFEALCEAAIAFGGASSTKILWVGFARDRNVSADGCSTVFDSGFDRATDGTFESVFVAPKSVAGPSPGFVVAL